MIPKTSIDILVPAIAMVAVPLMTFAAENSARPPAPSLTRPASAEKQPDVDGFILSPLVLKETTNLHPVVILLAVIVGAELLGLWGILAAIPVAGVIQFVLRQSLVPRVSGSEPPDEPVPMGETSMGIPG